MTNPRASFETYPHHRVCYVSRDRQENSDIVSASPDEISTVFSENCTDHPSTAHIEVEPDRIDWSQSSDVLDDLVVDDDNDGRSSDDFEDKVFSKDSNKETISQMTPARHGKP